MYVCQTEFIDTMHFKVILIITILAAMWPAHATGNNRDRIKAELQKELSVVVSPRDSIRVLTQLLDLANLNERPKVGWELYRTSSRVGNDEVALDALRQLTNCYSKQDSMLAKIEHCASLLTESPEQKETILLIHMQRISSKSRYDSEEQRLLGVKELLSERKTTDNTQPDDLYNEILQCYRICAYLGYSTKSSLSTEYFEKLKGLIDRLPYGLVGLRSFYYTQAALIYSGIEEHAKAIEADRELLKVINAMEKDYSLRGRNYRDYTRYRYICYRRMLSNYPALTREEVEKYYQKAKELTTKDPDVANDFNTQQRPTMYYLLANKRYREALPIIKKQFDFKYSNNYRGQILRTMCKAAESCGDTTTWIKALTEYASQLEDAYQNSSAEAYRELQIRYDISELKEANARLEMERMNSQINADRIVMAVTISAIAILLIFLIIIARKYHTSRVLRNRKTNTDGQS